MRTIKFRAWDKGNKHFCYFGLSRSSDADIEGLGIFAMVEKQQFTGLLDKDGKEIYEGDIILFGEGLGDEGTGEYEIGEVVYEAPCFVVDRREAIKAGESVRYIKWASEFFSDCEVIGNIYENPELLK